jgi:MFS transporter, FHS family, L-fucose permease
MNFLAYLFMGIPSGNMLVKIGYKKTALIAMAVGFIGLFIQYIPRKVLFMLFMI